MTTTPGPWKVLGGTVIVTDNPSNRFIASVPEADSTRFYEVRENAKLLAAAPDLLYACKLALDSITGLLPGIDTESTIVLPALREAITKAGG